MGKQHKIDILNDQYVVDSTKMGTPLKILCTEELY